MPKTKPSCFISYCHQDMDTQTLEKFEELLTEVSEDYIEFIRDVRHPVGGNWDEFMEIVNSADAAILLLTPEYKKRVTARAGGVYEEFRRIFTRFSNLKEARKLSGEDRDPPLRSFALIPIIFSGDASSSLPNEIARENYKDFAHFHVDRDQRSKRIIIADSVKSQFLPIVKEIIWKIEASIIDNILDFRFTQEKYFDLLLINTKDENLTQLSRPKRNYIFTKTRSYGEINKERSFIIVGRKGSGKSTITRYIADQHMERYKKRIHFFVDDVNLEMLFEVEAFSLKKYRSDTRVIRPQIELMKAI